MSTHGRRAWLHGLLRAGVQAAAAGSVLLAWAPAHAQTRTQTQADNWPSRPIHLVVPSSPGGAADFTARTFARYLEARTGQSVVIDNKPGAAAIIGAVAAKNAAPDGYTFLMAGNSTHAANSSLFIKLPYDPAKDFDEVGMFGVFPMIGMVRKGSQLDSMATLVKLAKQKPGKLTYGYYTASSQVPSELLKSRAGIDVLPIPYKSVGDLVNALVGGFVDFAFVDALSAWPTLQGGLLTAFAVTSATPFAPLPGVAPAAAALPGFEVLGWLGLAAPKGTPPQIIDKMSGYMRSALAEPTVRDALQHQGMAVRAMSPAEQEQFAEADRRRWAEWVRIAKIAPSPL